VHPSSRVTFAALEGKDAVTAQMSKLGCHSSEGRDDVTFAALEGRDDVTFAALEGKDVDSFRDIMWFDNL